MKKSVVLLLVAAMLLSGCASAAATRSPQQLFENKAAQNYDSAGMMPAASMAPAAPAAEAPAPGGDSFASGGAQAATVERLVIKNATLSIIVKDPAQSMDAIAKMADEMTGWVVTSNLYKTTTSEGIEVPQATINIRVPAEQLNDALTKIKALTDNPKTDVKSENVSGEDVTSQYTDLKSRLTNLEQAEAQLREIMASATKTEDVLNVFNQLTQVRGDIEVIKGQMKYYEESSSFSAINVDLISQETIKPLTVAGWQPQGVVRDAFQALINFGKGLVEVVIWFIILVLPILVVIYLVIRLLIWLIKKIFPSRKKVVPAAVEAAVQDQEKK
jgi:hypothetical protein